MEEHHIIKSIGEIQSPDIEKYDSTGAWGLSTALDLHDCDPETIRDADAIKRFVITLCDLIKAGRYGDTVVVHFGADERIAGFSMMQLLECSLLSGHFANLTNRVYLDIFSCAYYDPNVAAQYAKEFFKARSVVLTSILRH